MKVAVVINRRGGTVLQGQIDQERIERAFEQAGVAASVVFAGPEEITREVTRAVEQSADAVVIGGGDGSISGTAGILAGTNTPLGVLPLGSANHFARDLNLPLDLEGAVRVIAQGEIKPLSVAEVNGRIFVNNSLLGFFPHVVRARRALRKRLPVNKIIARWIAAAQVFPTFPLMSVELEAEGRTLACTTPFLFVGAHEYQMDFFRFGAPVRTDQGKLFIYMVRHPSRGALLKLFLTGFFRDVRQEKHFEAWEASELTVHTEHPTVTVFADGELFEMQLPLRYRSLPGALRVIVPPESTGPAGA